MPTSGLAPYSYAGELGERPRFPAGLALHDHDLWVADTFAGVVQHYVRGRFVGSIGKGYLVEPRDVAVHAGRVYVVDSARGSVEVFAGARHVASVGRGALDHPRGVAVDGKGRLLVSDVGHNRVAAYDTSSFEQTGEITDGVHIPHGMCVDGDALWVASSSRQYDGDCGVTRYVDDKATVTLGDGQQSTFGSMSNPAHVAVQDGRVLVTVPDFGLVQRFEATGAFVDEFGVEGRGLLRRPLGLVVEGRDVLVADSGQRRVVTFRSPR